MNKKGFIGSRIDMSQQTEKPASHFMRCLRQEVRWGDGETTASTMLPSLSFNVNTCLHVIRDTGKKFEFVDQGSTEGERVLFPTLVSTHLEYAL